MNLRYKSNLDSIRSCHRIELLRDTRIYQIKLNRRKL